MKKQNKQEIEETRNGVIVDNEMSGAERLALVFAKKSGFDLVYQEGGKRRIVTPAESVTILAKIKEEYDCTSSDLESEVRYLQGLADYVAIGERLFGNTKLRGQVDGLTLEAQQTTAVVRGALRVCEGGPSAGEVTLDETDRVFISELSDLASRHTEKMLALSRDIQDAVAPLMRK